MVLKRDGNEGCKAISSIAGSGLEVFFPASSFKNSETILMHTFFSFSNVWDWTWIMKQDMEENGIPTLMLKRAKAEGIFSVKLTLLS